MLKQESLVSLFSLLQEMTLINRDKYALRSPAWMRRLEFVMIVFYVLIVIAMLVAALVQHERPSPINKLVLESLYLSMIFSGMVYILIAIFSMGFLFWSHRGQGFPVQFARLKIDMLADADFLGQLFFYDKATLEYALLQYRSRWDSQDGRVGLLIGDLGKIGLFPALTASSMAASTLLKNNANMYFWMPLILASCFYLIGFYARGRQERPRQVIDLLDYAIVNVEVMTEQG